MEGYNRLMGEIKESLECNGALERVGKNLTNRCYEKIGKIEKIASAEGRGDKLGKANMDYKDFLYLVTPLLSKEQLKDLSQKYRKVQKKWKKK